MKLTTKQNEIVNEFRNQGVPAEWAILVLQRTDHYGLTQKLPVAFSDFVGGAFWWSSSPEGQEFWAGVADAAFSEEQQ